LVVPGKGGAFQGRSAPERRGPDLGNRLAHVVQAFIEKSAGDGTPLFLLRLNKRSRSHSSVTALIEFATVARVDQPLLAPRLPPESKQCLIASGAPSFTRSTSLLSTVNAALSCSGSAKRRRRRSRPFRRRLNIVVSISDASCISSPDSSFLAPDPPWLSRLKLANKTSNQLVRFAGAALLQSDPGRCVGLWRPPRP
jgi:hypothetical protein